MTKHLTKRQRKEQEKIQLKQQKRKNEFLKKSLLSRTPAWTKWTFGIIFTAGIIGLASLLNRQNDNYAPNVKQQTNNLQYIDAKPTLRKDGWRVFVD